MSRAKKAVPSPPKKPNRKERREHLLRAPQNQLHNVEQPRDDYARPPNEISPFIGREIDDVVRGGPTEAILRRIRKEKNLGRRARPSSRLTLVPPRLDNDHRAALLDKVADLVDQNAFGRSEMCVQFALLLQWALSVMGVEAKAVHGPACYLRGDRNWAQWPDHAWVETSAGEIIDGNIDSVVENTLMPGVRPYSYWGPRAQCPTDRIFPSPAAQAQVSVGDVEDMDNWWRELHRWLVEQGLAAADVVDEDQTR